MTTFKRLTEEQTIPAIKLQPAVNSAPFFDVSMEVS